MSKKSTWLSTNLGKYWFIQITLIIALVVYSVFASVSIFVLVNNNGLISSNNQTNSNEIVVTLLFESKVPSKPITWNAIVTKATNKSTLLEVMNTTLTIGGSSYGKLGFLINKINTIQNDNTNFWTYYYYSKDSGWIYSPIGVSNFILNHDFQIKWVFGPASS